MANRDFSGTQALNRQVTFIAGSFAPDGANAPVKTQGLGFSVVRASQGVFTITFQDAYPALLATKGSLQLAVAAARFIQFGAYNATNQTLSIRVIDASGVAQDVAANADNVVSFECTFQNSSVPSV
jgi:hypothetical protein